jgi:tetratricopeptide (TPR) repeat protein
VLLGRTALARGETTLVPQTLEAAQSLAGKVNYTPLAFIHQLYPRLLAAAAALHWRMPGYESIVREVLEEAAARPWDLDQLHTDLSDLTVSSHPRWDRDELHIVQNIEYVPAFEAASTDLAVPADLRGLCALLVETALSITAFDPGQDELQVRETERRMDAAFETAMALTPDSLWLHYRQTSRLSGQATPESLQSFARWAPAALQAGTTPDPMLFRSPDAEPWPQEITATVHRMLINGPQKTPVGVRVREILREEAWEYGGWPESLEAYDLKSEIYEMSRWRLSLKPQDPARLFSAASNAENAGLTDVAQSHYEALLQLPVADVTAEPNKTVLFARYNLALLYIAENEPKEALTQLELLLTQDPSNADAGELIVQVMEQLMAPPQNKRTGSRTGKTAGFPPQPGTPALPAGPSDFLQSASARYPAIQPVARKLLGVLALLGRPLSEAELAQHSGMDSIWTGRHLGTLLKQGMLTQEGRAYRLNPAIATQARLDADHVTTTRLLHAGNGQAAMPIFRSQRERLVYSSLLHQFPNQLVFPNMALQSIFSYDLMKVLLDNDDFGYYLKAIADFCVVSTVNYLPLLVLEVDSAYHDLEAAQIKDARKDRIVTLGGLSLLRVRPHGQPTEAMVHAEVTQAVNELIRSGLAPALSVLRNGWTPPEEASPGSPSLAEPSGEHSQD